MFGSEGMVAGMGWQTLALCGGFSAFLSSCSKNSLFIIVVLFSACW